MNILFIGNHLQESGYSEGVSYLIGTQLKTKGHGIIFTSTKVNKLLRLFDMLQTIFNRKSEYEIAQIDVFSGSAFLWSFLCACSLKALKKPIVLTLHGGNLPVFAKYRAGLLRYLLNSANIVTVPSPYLQKSMARFRNDIRIIPNPIRIQAYEYRKRDKPQPNLIWLRAFHKIYNPELAPQVFAALVPLFPDAKLYMIGPDKGDGSLQDTKIMVEDLRLSSQIHFPGLIQKKDVPSWLNKGDIFINTTNIDNTPVSILEALACGMCIVSTNVGGIPYLVENENEALLVPPNDIDAFKNAIIRILTENDLACRLSENAKARIEKSDLSKVINEWENLFSSLVSN